MTHKLLAPLLVAALFSIGSCTSDDPTTGTQYFSLAYSDFIAAQTLVVSAPLTTVFRDQASWSAFWTTHGPAGTAAPTVDWTQDMLIGVFWGPSGTGCGNYVNAVTQVRLRIDGINTTGVIEVEVGPLGDLGNCAMPVLPLQILLTDTTSAPVQFVGTVPS
jgi:hypothetical protein